MIKAYCLKSTLFAKNRNMGFSSSSKARMIISSFCAIY